MNSYFDHQHRTQITKAQRDRLWRELKGESQPRVPDVVAGDVPPMSDPTVTATRRALDANAPAR